MTIVFVDPNLSLSSPSMKGIVRALPYLKEQGCTLEGWCWDHDAGLPFDKLVCLPRLGDVHTLRGYAFSLLVRLRAWWQYTWLKKTRPDVIFSMCSYLPNCDTAMIQFSPFDWEKRQQQLGMHTLRDVFDRVTNRFNLYFTRHFLRHTSAKSILCVSKAIAQDVHTENPSLNLRLLPNGYDPTRFNTHLRQLHRADVRQQLEFQEHDIVFVFASAGHYRRKGFPLVVAALKLLRKEHTQARLLVLGGTSTRLAELKSQLTSDYPDWQDWITFTGMVPDVERYFAASDAFLFPSYSEAFALVEVEAAACGLPLFLTRHHGSEMILEDGVNGRYLDFDADNMAQVLSEFVTGSWKPQPCAMKQALDSTAYAKRLLEELQMIAHAN
jgi:glycosyltransferase involved in cell wall biosynthesis